MIPNAKCKEADEAAGASALHSPKLKEADAIRKLSDALGENLQKMFVHGSLHGDTLTLYFMHQVGVLEFNRDKEEILRKMRLIFVKEKMLGILVFKQVKAEVKHRQIKRETKHTVQRDRANGDFKIEASDPQLAQMFKQIQEHIKETNAQAGQ